MQYEIKISKYDKFLSNQIDILIPGQSMKQQQMTTLVEIIAQNMESWKLQTKTHKLRIVDNT